MLLRHLNNRNATVLEYIETFFNRSRVILARHTSLFLDKRRHCDNCLIKNVMRT